MQHWSLQEIDVQPHQPQVLSTHSEGRVIVLFLPGGEQLQEHQVHERAWVHVVSGDAVFDVGGEQVEAGPGTLFEFDPRERHSVTARSDTRLLLTLAPWPGEGHPSNH